MAQTPSTQLLALGSSPPAFHLPAVDGTIISPAGIEAAPALVVMFICNHCPFVKHLNAGIVALAREFQPKGVAFVAINSNDVEAYPEDAPAKMRELAREVGYPFPYLFDADQSVAKAYRASCTPDFFVFAADRGLIYRGQFDGSRPVKEGAALPVSGADLRLALDAALTGEPLEGGQSPSIGCNIKWKPGNEPDYATALTM